MLPNLLFEGMLRIVSVLGLMVIVSSPALALPESDLETSTEAAIDLEPSAQLEPIDRALDPDPMAQVTSISQLSDVEPTDWAFQALQSLVERYGVIAGYPDGTYRGDRAMTRYEFAAGLNAFLDRVNELTATPLLNIITREDLATLQRLQEEFAAELATLRGRVDALEARTAELEANQFSTTTRLEGDTQFLVSGVLTNNDEEVVNAAGEVLPDSDQAVFVNRMRLNFLTSFTGEDELEVSLEAGNFQNETSLTNDQNEEQVYTGNPFRTDPLGFQAGGDADNIVDLDDLIYTLPVGERVELLIGATGLDIDDPVNDISPFTSSSTGSISEFGDVAVYEQTFPGTGAGLGGSISLLDQDAFDILVEFAYVADEGDESSAGNGLFNGDYAALGQLTFESDLVDVALTYVNSYTSDASTFGRIGGVYEVSGAAVSNTYGGQFNFKLFDDRLQIGGGAAFSDIEGIGASEDFEAWSWQGTLAVTDIGSEGSLLGILAGVPTYTRELTGQSDDTAFLVEGFYRFQLTDNIALTPSVIWINDPFNVNDNEDTVIGTLRTTFSF